MTTSAIGPPPNQLELNQEKEILPFEGGYFPREKCFSFYKPVEGMNFKTITQNGDL